MKRLVPLWITAVGGFVLIFAYFIPVTQGWGEVAAIWFDVLAAIAFVLGGGNLIKIHLKKMSDRAKGWGYSLITLLSFLIMLYVGLGKVGAPPAPNQEFYGETWARLGLESLPAALEFRVVGAIPGNVGGHELHASVRREIRESNGELIFTGWMNTDQRTKLKEYRDKLDWHCTVESLYDAAQPPPVLAGRVAYHADHDALAFVGRMTDEQRDTLLAMGDGAAWVAAVRALHLETQRVTSVTVTELPPNADPARFPRDMVFDPGDRSLKVTGEMTRGQLGALAGLFPKARPLDAAQRRAFLDGLRTLGPVSEGQERAFNAYLDGQWTAETLRDLVNAAGAIEDVDKTACEMVAERDTGVAQVEPKKRVGDDLSLNEAQIALLSAYASDPAMTTNDLIAQLESSGPFKEAQASALRTYLGGAPTVPERDKGLAFAMLKVEGRDAAGKPVTLNAAQRDRLLGGHRAQARWRQEIGALFIASHVVKYPWSGEYRAQGTPFWWLYEYAFKPLQATIFAMLAFYVASAAFRAFRAKNVEASLLLGTAFIILLGRTFAGPVMTAWMPDMLSGLKIENMTVTIMQVFNTAGNRAIMIGIALGIASTSLKVLLGVDRSYLGSGED